MQKRGDINIKGMEESWIIDLIWISHILYTIDQPDEIDTCTRIHSYLQTTAKQQYLLTDTDLKQLGSLERKNPRQIDWNPMKLYMESQVRNVAHAKYGGQAGLEWEARVKVSKKLESRIQVCYLS